MMRRILQYAVLCGLILFFALFLLGPVYTVVEVGISPALLKEVFNNYIYLEGLVNSFAIAAVTTLMVFFISLPLALLFDRCNFPMKEWCALLVMIP
ncbi:MAG: hypothetical protein J6C40_14765, partial [Lentisphaeria bacterium]|nr:hypothetical protein [Lentisphaeria bacterium]